jgi:hypothetical protein
VKGCRIQDAKAGGRRRKTKLRSQKAEASAEKLLGKGGKNEQKGSCSLGGVLSLAKNKVTIPQAAKGKVTLIMVAFLRESQPQIDSWLGPFTRTFGGREGFTFYEIPMISSGYRFMSFMIDSGMRSGIPKEKHDNVVTYYGNIEKYTKALQIDPRSGHVFLLDREGIIRWQARGFATDETLKELFDLAEKLAQG